MLYTLLIAVGFLISAFVQVTVISAFGTPLALLPLHLALGVTLLHRGRMELGIAWFAFTPLASVWIGPIVGTWWSYVIIAALGPVLVLRIFARRSLLALMGLGWVLYLVFAVLNIYTFQTPISLFSWGLPLLTLLLVGISYIERRWRALGNRFVLIRHV